MRWTILASLVLWLASCGQKGPLYLPEKNAQPDNNAPHLQLDVQLNMAADGHVPA